MSSLYVREGVQHVHTGDTPKWAIDVSLITTTPVVDVTTVQVYDDSAGGANVTAGLVFTGSVEASGTNILLPLLGGTLGTGWQVNHRYRVTATFRDTSTGATFVRGIEIVVDY